MTWNLNNDQAVDFVNNTGASNTYAFVFWTLNPNPSPVAFITAAGAMTLSGALNVGDVNSTGNFSTQQMILNNCPSSPTGLISGQLWCNGNAVTRVP